MTLDRALDYIDGLEAFTPADRMRWIYMRNEVGEWLKGQPRDAAPALSRAHNAVNDRPEYLPDEGERWEELRHQLVVEIG